MKKSELRQMIREMLREELETAHSTEHYTVAFDNNDPNGVLFIGTEAECEDFVKKIQDSPAAKHHGIKVSKGADIFVDRN